MCGILDCYKFNCVMLFYLQRNVLKINYKNLQNVKFVIQNFLDGCVNFYYDYLYYLFSRLKSWNGVCSSGCCFSN